jgi:para-nitrobenzyl esterase
MSETIVQTIAGAVQGERLPGLRRWLGIPYASAPRLAAPGPVEPWRDVRDATRFGRQCPQQMGGKVRRETLEGEGFGEDCLFLNVWTPEGGAPGPKPVLVWIHGGAFLAGGSNAYDGALLAAQGDIVVVSINYRLGALGWVNFGEALGLPAIPSNIGLRDQIAALEWVRDNIAEFGGDPERVTICGESAGSMSVSLLMLSPRARGLFHAGVMQSGAVSLVHSRERSIEDARRFAEVLDLKQDGLERLKSMDVADLLTAQTRVGNDLACGIPAAPWYDGDLLPASLEDALGHDAAPVPLLAGSTRDEIVLFDLMPGSILPSKWHELEPLLFGQLPHDHAQCILAAYPRNRRGRIALASDLTFLMPTRNFAERHSRAQPTWVYRFDYSHPVAGATHGLDLMLFWPFTGFMSFLARGGLNSGRRRALGDRMRGHVAHFVRHHAPGEDWQGYRPDERHVRLYNLEDRMVHDPEPERMAAWGGRDVTPGLGRAPL